MSDFAIRAENLSKVYRIGANERRHETLMGAVAAVVKAPLANYRNLRKLSQFDDVKNGNGTNDASDVLWALRDVSFEVKHGEVLGLIGRNGAGKSTLLKILARITEPSSGQAEIQGRVGSLLEVGTGFHPDLTGRENVYLNGTILGMKKREVDSKFDEIVGFSGIEKFIDTPVKRYSSGMRVRLAFSVAAHLEPEVLLVDEVLAVGDAEFQKKCLGKMGEVATQGRTVLFVSHNMEAILNLCPNTYLLEGGRIQFHGASEGAVSRYLELFSSPKRNGASHVLYESGADGDAQTTKILRLEILDELGQPKQTLRTWDDLVIRIHYSAMESFDKGTFVLDVFDHKQQRLVVLDSGLRVPIRAGCHSVDCRIPRLPLAAGEYFIGGGLAVSNSQWLWREPNMSTIQVQGRDVFEIGRPPESKRMLFAVEHAWGEQRVENGSKIQAKS